MSRQAHPMIQPTDWSVDPAAARVIWGRRNHTALYELIYQSAVAYQLKPPVLQIERTFLKAPVGAIGEWIAIDQVQPSGMAGYWRYRQDLPDDDRPLPSYFAPMMNASVGNPAVGRYTLMGASLRPVGALTLPRLCILIEEQRVITPAAIVRSIEVLLGAGGGESEALAELVDEDGGVLDGQQLRSGSLKSLPTAYLRLTQRGQAALDAWKGYCDPIRREAFDAQPLAAWAQMGVSGDQAQAIEDYITRCIESVPTEAESRAAVGEDLQLPAQVDPDRVLPLDHPLRAFKARMLAVFQEAYTDWPSLPVGDQVRLRTSYIAELTQRIDEVLKTAPAEVDPEALADLLRRCGLGAGRVASLTADSTGLVPALSYLQELRPWLTLPADDLRRRFEPIAQWLLGVRGRSAPRT